MKNNIAKSPNRLKILFADDEPSIQDCMSIELPRMGHEVTVCPDGFTALAALEKNAYDCLLVDLDMPGMSGMQLVERIRQNSPETEAIILTGKSSLDSAISALRHGVFDYLTKPCKLAELDALLKRVAEKRDLRNRCRALQHRLERIEGKTQLIGDSPQIAQVRSRIARVAPTESTVLILGETGTGKELAARAVHDQSSRREQPFVAINCGALPESLIESELFGHRKGAFTGAEESRAGLFEVAHGGTLFLDEIGELPKSMQAKLLRVLETGDLRRVGENQSIQVDVRVIGATHRNLEQMVDQGDFREDLMFRINTFEITLPYLRERPADIRSLAEHLYRRFRPMVYPRDGLLFSPEAIEYLYSHSWPGNVRELANVIEHALILCDQPPVLLEHLPPRLAIRKGKGKSGRGALGPMTLQELEMQAILESVDRHAGNKPAAAEELGISLKTLYNRLSQISSLEKSA